MDDRMREDLRKTARELAENHRARLEAAGTLVDIEKLTTQIGDELAREVAKLELGRRSEEIGKEPRHACPDCGRECPVEPELEPVLLQGMRGDIEYQEPRCYCTRCRRAFFPSGRPTGTTAARAFHARGS